MKREVRVRIAPSPTGFAHVGTAYTALFNMAFAKKNDGKFILRLEDTDQKRNIEEAEQPIYDALHWLGLNWDEGPDIGGEFSPYRQSERVEIYNPFINKLLESKKAYEDDGAIYLKVPKADIAWTDLIRGEVVFPADQMKDLVIRKSDGFPTYHFAVVVDDHLMKISHVIRAEDHISNTPKQIPIYKALNFDIPEFAHTPLLRNTDKSKMSKRKNNIEIGWYKEEGYLPESLINYFSLLGWSHPEEKEIFTREEFFEKFSLDRIRKTGPVFDINKLRWMNSEYIKNLEPSKLVLSLYNFYEQKYSLSSLKEIVPLVRERINSLKEYESIAKFFYKEQKIDFKLFGENYKDHLASAIKVVESLENWDKVVESFENINLEKIK